MINLFKRVRKSLLNEGKTRKYLKYAIGEIVLVVIGILIALQVNNWNENRKNIQKAKEFRERLVNDIYRAEAETTEPKAKTIEEKWQFVVQAFHTSQIWNLDLSAATFTEIQNSGLLGYIGSPELINILSEYYVDFGSQLNQLNGGTTEYRDYIRSIIPIKVQDYIWHSCYVGVNNLISQTLKACDAPKLDAATIENLYQQIINDEGFKRLLTRRLSTIFIRNAVYAGKITQGNDLILSIQKMK